MPVAGPRGGTDKTSLAAIARDRDARPPADGLAARALTPFPFSAIIGLVFLPPHWHQRPHDEG